MAASCYLICYNARFRFEAEPADVWSALARLDQFEGWWGWLGGFRARGRGLHQGTVLEGTVTPPLPYQMHVVVELDRCVPPRRIDATVRGDLEGDAHLRLVSERPGTRAEVRWSLEMMQRPMRLAARVAHPVLQWGHDRVVDATVSAFRAQLQREPVRMRSRSCR